MTHKSEDYKISAVKYYLKNKDNIRKTCKIFDCKKSNMKAVGEPSKRKRPWLC
jgi:transposase-like protein